MDVFEKICLNLKARAEVEKLMAEKLAERNNTRQTALYPSESRCHLLLMMKNNKWRSVVFIQVITSEDVS